MLKLTAAAIAILVLSMAPARSQEAGIGRFAIHQGTIDTGAVTLRLDTATGATWFLGSVDRNGQVWVTAPQAQRNGGGLTTVWVPLTELPRAR